MVAGLRPAPGIAFVVPTGAPSLFLDVADLDMSGDEFARLLLDGYGVPTDPGSAFGSSAHIRLAFGGEDATIAEAARRITTAAGALAARRRSLVGPG